MRDLVCQQVPIAEMASSIISLRICKLLLFSSMLQWRAYPVQTDDSWSCLSPNTLKLQCSLSIPLTLEILLPFLTHFEETLGVGELDDGNHSYIRVAISSKETLGGKGHTGVCDDSTANRVIEGQFAFWWAETSSWASIISWFHASRLPVAAGFWVLVASTRCHLWLGDGSHSGNPESFYRKLNFLIQR